MRAYRHALPAPHPLARLLPLLPVAAFALSVPFWGPMAELVHSTDRISTWLHGVASDHRMLAYAGYMLYLAAMLSLSLPLLMPSILLAGAVFDFWEAVALVTAGRMLAAALCFALTRYFMTLAQALARRPWCARLRSRMRRKGAGYVLLLRMLPLMPDSVVSYGMGITPMRWSTYLGMSFLGMLPLTLLSIYLGSEINRVTDIHFWRSLLPPPEILIGIAAILCLFYTGMRLALRPVANPFEHQLPIGAAAYRRRLMLG